jgi:hypothetical protein
MEPETFWRTLAVTMTAIARAPAAKSPISVRAERR